MDVHALRFVFSCRRCLAVCVVVSLRLYVTSREKVANADLVNQCSVLGGGYDVARDL